MLFLFNIYSESIREELEGFEGSIEVGSKTVTNLGYADNVALLAGGADELQELLNRTQVAGIKVKCGKDKGNVNIQEQQPG